MANRADQRKFHYIYKISRIDGKFYVGMHSTDDLNDGYFGSGQLLWKSIKKHGKEKHSKEILEFLPSRKELKDRERQIVNEELIGDKLCMNLKLGGEGGWYLTPAQQAIGRLAGASRGGSASRKIQQPRAVEARRTCGKTFATFTGKQHSNESRAKTSASMVGKQDGQKNSQFGTCWVTKDASTVKIRSDLLEEYIAQGYARGRK